MVLLNSLLTVSITWLKSRFHQVCVLIYRLWGVGVGESASKCILVVGKIQLLVGIGLRSLFPCSLAVSQGPLFASRDQLYFSSCAIPHVQASNGISNLSCFESL